MKTIGDVKSSKHLYEVEVIKVGGKRETWSVHANTRTQASKIAEQWDVVVASVNMVG